MKVSKPVLSLFVIAACLVPASCQRNNIEHSLTRREAVLPLGSFDVPAANSPVKGQVLFSGWAAHQSGIDFVSLYLDGVYQATATLGINRPDVLRSFPQFNSSMISGWSARIDTSTWGQGPHSVIAKAVSKSGVDRDLFLTVVASK